MWKDINDELPDTNRAVLLDTNRGMLVSKYTLGSGCYWTKLQYNQIPLYWMELPKSKSEDLNE